MLTHYLKVIKLIIKTCNHANNSIYTGSWREQVYPAEEYQAVLRQALGVLEHRGAGDMRVIKLHNKNSSGRMTTTI